MEQIIINLVENFPDYKHVFPYNRPGLADFLMKKGYHMEYAYDFSHYTTVSKNKTFHERIVYCGLDITKLEDITVESVDGKISKIDNNLILIDAGCLSFQRAFEGYDENSSTLPELWVRLCISIYGPIPINVTFIRTTRTEASKLFTPEEIQVNKLL